MDGLGRTGSNIFRTSRGGSRKRDFERRELVAPRPIFRRVVGPELAVLALSPAEDLAAYRESADVFGEAVHGKKPHLGQSLDHRGRGDESSGEAGLAIDRSAANDTIQIIAPASDGAIAQKRASRIVASGHLKRGLA